jgi:urea transporter
MIAARRHYGWSISRAESKTMPVVLRGWILIPLLKAFSILDLEEKQFLCNYGEGRDDRWAGRLRNIYVI